MVRSWRPGRAELDVIADAGIGSAALVPTQGLGRRRNARHV